MKLNRIGSLVIALFATLMCSIGNAQTISIQLPVNPMIDSIPNQWRGHNEGAKSLVSENQTTDFCRNN